MCVHTCIYMYTVVQILYVHMHTILTPVCTRTLTHNMKIHRQTQTYSRLNMYGRANQCSTGTVLVTEAEAGLKSVSFLMSTTVGMYTYDILRFDRISFSISFALFVCSCCCRLK